MHQSAALTLGTAMMQSSVPAFVFDSDSRVVDCNEALAALFAVPRATARSFDLSGILPTGPFAAIERALRGEHATWTGQYTSQLAAREIKGVLRVSPVREGDVVIGGIALIEVRDAATSDDEVAQADTRLATSWYGTIDALWEYDETTRALRLSPRVREMLGYSVEELPNALDAVMSLVHPDDHPVVIEIFRAHRDELAPVDAEVRLRDADGGWRFVRVRAQGIRNADGTVVKYVGSLGDVTPMHRARAVAREAEAMFRAVAEQSVTGICVVANGRFVFANQRTADMFGTTLDELLAIDNLTAWVHPEDAARLDAVLREYTVSAAYRIRTRRPDGSQFLVDVHGSRIDIDGQQMGFATLIDVTSRVESDQKIAEALADADLDRRQLRAMLDALPVGVWISDASGNLLTTNAAAARIWGGKAPRVRREHFDVYEAWWPKTGERITRAEWSLARALREKATIPGERIEFRRFDGTRGAAITSSAAIFDATGAVTGGVLAMLDITEHRELERQRESLIASLEFERKRLETLFAGAPTFFASLRGEQHVIELANDAYMKQVGNRDIVGKPIAEALPELVDQGFLEPLAAVWRTGRPFTATQAPLMLGSETEGRRTKFVDFSLIPITDEHGARVGILLNGYEVTDQVDAQQALLASERRMRAQFKAVPIPTYVFQLVERDGVRAFGLVDHSDAVASIERTTGIRAADFLAEAVRVEQLWAALEASAPRSQELEYPAEGVPDARRLVLTYCAAPPDIVVVHCEDVTDRVRLAEQLRQAQKMEAVGQLAGGIAHDFNNLLSVISTCAEFLSETIDAADRRRIDVEEIRRASARATDLTQKLLTFGRRQVVRTRSLQVDAVVGSTEAMLRRLIGDPIRIVLELDAGPATVRADAGQLEQVLMNLAINARDAMPDGGTLTIKTTNRVLDAALAAERSVSPGKYVALVVEDTGCGIPPAVMSRLFEPFFTTKEVGKGTGLGLPTIYGVAKQLGGYIHAETVVGSGSAFEFGLPAEATVATRAPPELPRRTARILVVDDEPGILLLARRILERSGFEVTAVASGRAALECAVVPFDLVITDFVMPDMNGRQLHRELERRFPGVRVLYISGYVDDEEVRHDHDAPAAFLAKPFTSATLIEAVRAALTAEAST